VEAVTEGQERLVQKLGGARTAIRAARENGVEIV
jgi:hypothetical protein